MNIFGTDYVLCSNPLSLGIFGFKQNRDAEVIILIREGVIKQNSLTAQVKTYKDSLPADKYGLWTNLYEEVSNKLDHTFGILQEQLI